LTCQYAAGVGASPLLNATLENATDLSGGAARNRRSIVNGDPRVTFRAAGIAAETVLRSALICPLHYNDAFIGCLALYHVESDHYTDDHRRLVEWMAEQAGAVIQNAVVFENTQESALTDPLTGLPSSRSMFVFASRELARADRLRTQVALIAIDVDEFKSINDMYGHSVGDHALRQVADTLRGAVRAYDLCIRSAGDEFVLVLGECSREAADDKCRELQARIANIHIDVRRGRRLSVAASAGAAVFPEDGTTYEQLLAAADHRMTRDKIARRERSPEAPPRLPSFDPAEALEAAVSRARLPQVAI
jgi:diguanylate cyclase (GGDEF)-like protein